MSAKFDLFIQKPRGFLFNNDSSGDIYAVSEGGKGKEILSITFIDELDLLVFTTLVNNLLNNSEGANELKSALTLSQEGDEGTKLYVDGFAKSKNKVIFTKQGLRAKQPATVVVPAVK